MKLIMFGRITDETNKYLINRTWIWIVDFFSTKNEIIDFYINKN